MKQETKKFILNFLENKGNYTRDCELTDFLQQNNIEYMFFENIDEIFDYYNFESYNVQDFNTLFFESTIFTKSGIIILT